MADVRVRLVFTVAMLLGAGRQLQAGIAQQLMQQVQQCSGRLHGSLQQQAAAAAAAAAQVYT
jgi:hypothetical protein